MFGIKMPWTKRKEEKARREIEERRRVIQAAFGTTGKTSANRVSARGPSDSDTLSPSFAYPPSIISSYDDSPVRVHVGHGGSFDGGGASGDWSPSSSSDSCSSSSSDSSSSDSSSSCSSSD